MDFSICQIISLSPPRVSELHPLCHLHIWKARFFLWSQYERNFTQSDSATVHLTILDKNHFEWGILSCSDNSQHIVDCKSALFNLDFQLSDVLDKRSWSQNWPIWSNLLGWSHLKLSFSFEIAIQKDKHIEGGNRPCKSTFSYQPTYDCTISTNQSLICRIYIFCSFFVA